RARSCGARSCNPGGGPRCSRTRSSRGWRRASCKGAGTRRPSRPPWGRGRRRCVRRGPGGVRAARPQRPGLLARRGPGRPRALSPTGPLAYRTSLPIAARRRARSMRSARAGPSIAAKRCATTIASPPRRSRWIAGRPASQRASRRSSQATNVSTDAAWNRTPSVRIERYASSRRMRCIPAIVKAAPVATRKRPAMSASPPTDAGSRVANETATTRPPSVSSAGPTMSTRRIRSHASTRYQSSICTGGLMSVFGVFVARGVRRARGSLRRGAARRGAARDGRVVGGEIDVAPPGDRCEGALRPLTHQRVLPDELLRDERHRRPVVHLAQRRDRRGALVGLAALERRAHRVRPERAVELFEALARVSYGPPRLHRVDERTHGLVGVAERALEGSVAEHARRIRRRPDPVIPRERPGEAHVLARHVARDARAAGAARIVVRVRLQRRAIRERGVAGRAGLVPFGRGEGAQFRFLGASVRVVAGRTGHRGRAAAEEKIATFARVDVAPARHRVAPSTLPGEGIAGEEHLVATSADAVDR